MKKIILINFIITLFLIVTLELASRLLNLSSLGGMDSKLFYEENGNRYLTPNTEGIIFESKVYTDKNGYRVPNKNFKYDNLERVFIIGDSTTFGNGVLEEKTFVGHLRKNFAKKDFINSAVPGYQVKDYDVNIEKIKKFNNVKKIVYIVTLNDVFKSSNVVDKKKKYDESPKKFIDVLKNIAIVSELNFFLRKKSYFYMYVKGTFTDPSKRWYQNVDKFYKENNINHLLEFMTDLSKITIKDLYIITLPYEYQTRNCNDKNLFPQKKIQDLLHNKKINYYDFTKYFCSLDSPKDYFRKFDPMHLSPKGHKFVYNLIKNEISF